MVRLVSLFNTLMLVSFVLVFGSSCKDINMSGGANTVGGKDSNRSSGNTGGSSSNGQSNEENDENDEEGGLPENITGMYLSCTQVAAVSESIGTFGCGVIAQTATNQQAYKGPIEKLVAVKAFGGITGAPLKVYSSVLLSKAHETHRFHYTTETRGFFGKKDRNFIITAAEFVIGGKNYGIKTQTGEFSSYPGLPLKNLPDMAGCIRSEGPKMNDGRTFGICTLDQQFFKDEPFPISWPRVNPNDDLSAAGYTVMLARLNLKTNVCEQETSLFFSGKVVGNDIVAIVSIKEVPGKTPACKLCSGDKFCLKVQSHIRGRTHVSEWLY